VGGEHRAVVAFLAMLSLVKGAEFERDSERGTKIKDRPFAIHLRGLFALGGWSALRSTKQQSILGGMRKASRDAMGRTLERGFGRNPLKAWARPGYRTRSIELSRHSVGVIFALEGGSRFAPTKIACLIRVESRAAREIGSLRGYGDGNQHLDGQAEFVSDAENGDLDRNERDKAGKGPPR